MIKPNESHDLPGHPVIRGRGEPQIIDTENLIDCYVYDTVTSRNGKQSTMKGQVREKVDDKTYQVTFTNGKHRTYEYEDLINMINRPDEDGVELWDFEKIINHKWSDDPQRKGKIDVQLKWAGYEEPTWEPMENIKRDDPVSLAKYAQEMKLTNQSRWKWANNYLKRDKRFARMLRQVHLYKKKTNTVKYNFGVRIPKSIREARLLDKMNGNTKWDDAIEKELRALYEEHNCFEKLKDKNEIPNGYKYVPLLWVFAVKFDLRHRARCVAGGHVTDDLEQDVYSGVVDLETAKIALVAAILTQLQIVAADISSAYIQAFTIEKIYTIAGPEWSLLGLEGTVLIVRKALYGLKASGAMWHRKLADNLREMNFQPCTADHDFWIKDMKDHYEYIAVIVDDLLIFSKNGMKIINHMKEKYGYQFKGVGKPEYYNGADFLFTREGFPVMHCKTYVTNVCDRIEKVLGIKLKYYGSPMEVGDHPENDETDFLASGDITIYQMLIGCAQWAITLGRFDIQYATNSLARFAALPREGHKKRAIRIFGYLRHHPKARTIYDPCPLNLESIKFEDHDWTDLYPFAEEHIPEKALKPYNDHALDLTILIDASFASCDMTKRSMTAVIAILGSTVVKTHCKRQHTVETSTYGAEIVALRIGVEIALEIRYKLRMMGIKFNPVTNVLCDNLSVVINAQFPTSSLKKKHNAVAYHKIREAVAAGIIRIGHIAGALNLADILTKPLGPKQHYELLKHVLFPVAHNHAVLEESSKKAVESTVSSGASTDDNETTVSE